MSLQTSRPEDTTGRPARLRVSNVSVEYAVPTVQVMTLKEAVIQKLRGNLRNQMFRALDNVSVEAFDGECVAIMGHNGCGKSTLLKVMAGIIEPQSGAVDISGRIAPMIELGAGFDPELTGIENIHLSCTLLGLSRREIASKINDIVAFSELGEFIHAPVKTYSSGMYARLGFACSTTIEPDLLLVDEILSVGDENFQRKCLDRVTSMRARGRTIILVSHDLNTVSKFADRCYVLDHGKVVFHGLPVEAGRFYRRRMELALLYGSQEPPDAESPSEESTDTSQTKGDSPTLAPTPPKNVLESDEGRPGTGDCRIRAVVIVQEGSTNALLVTGKPWSVVVRFAGAEGSVSTHVNLGFALYSADLRRVHGGNFDF